MHVLAIDMRGDGTVRRGMSCLASGLLPRPMLAPLSARRPPLAPLAKAPLPLLDLETQLLQLQPERSVLALKLLNAFLRRHPCSMTGVRTDGQARIDLLRISISHSEP